MKNHLLALALSALLLPMSVNAQKNSRSSAGAASYESLWKQVQTEVDDNDRPQSAIIILGKIVRQAEQRGDYGHLLKAELMTLKLKSLISPDSLKPAVSRIEDRLSATSDAALQAVFHTTLSVVYSDFSRDDETWKQLSASHRRQAMSNPAALASVKATTYEPFVTDGKDSRLFGDDLLSVVGIQLGEWQWLNDYYKTTDNRAAACLTALRAIPDSLTYAQQLAMVDSLLAAYSDLDEASLLAESRYELMGYQNATPADKAAWLLTYKDRWAGRRGAWLRNEWIRLTASSFRFEGGMNVQEPMKPTTLCFRQLRNIASLSVRVYRTTLAGDTSLDPSVDSDYKKIAPGLKELKELSRQLAFSGHQPYEEFSDSAQLAGLPPGVYMIECRSQPHTETVRCLLFVSAVRVIAMPVPGNKTRFVVVDATTGHPKAGATLRISRKTGYGKPKSVETFAVSKNGELLYSGGSTNYSTVFASTADDRYCPETDCYGRYTYINRKYGERRVSVFTDRSIYRPGQRVHVGAIIWRELGWDSNQAVSGHETTIRLYDANRDLIESETVVTDSHGHCTASFTLPRNVLSGHFSVNVDGSYQFFRVEEYKRPTFQVEFPQHDGSYQAGDTVVARAKAVGYSGAPVQGGRVHYVVRRQTAFWWMSYRFWQNGDDWKARADAILAEGDTVTDDDGTFAVSMPLTLPANTSRSAMFYNFTCEATVTDQGGESHTAQLTLPLGTRPTVLTCDIPEQVRSDQLPAVTFSRRNAAGNEIPGTVSYRIDGGRWQQCAAGSRQNLLDKKTRSGRHTLEAICGSDTVTSSFIVFSLDDKRPAAPTDDWFYVSDNSFPTDGTPVTVQVGSSAPDVHMIYTVFSGDTLLESGSTRLDGQLLNRKLKYRDDYGNGLLLCYAWVKNGRFYSHQQTISRPQPDRRLRLKWTTFRDRLTPGTKEEWRLSVSNPDGTPADASLMAVMYDKSLDQLVAHGWSLNTSNYLPMPSTSWIWQTWRELSGYAVKDYKLSDVLSLQFRTFDKSVFPQYLYYRYGLVGSARKGRALRAVGSAAVRNSAVVESAEMDEAVVGAAPMAAMAKSTGQFTSDVAVEDAKGDNGGVPAEVSPRQNMQETAFFYPALRTDSTGDVTIAFTLPESITTWCFMSVANTADMLTGCLGGDIVARKELMVQPNMPRFIRRGDDAQLTTRIVNTSGRSISGTALMQLESAADGSLVMQQEMEFSVDSAQTTSVTFQIPSAMIGESLLVCRVIAGGDGFADGEQHYLPVLSADEQVVRTVSITQHAAGTHSVDVAALFPKVSSHRRLTVEYTNNPAWLMVQSLPTVGQPSDNSAIDLAAAFYSTSLARHLLSTIYVAKCIFEQWQLESGSETSLDSQLEKNQELKALLLEETPWVMAAAGERSQRRQLADFFDANTIDNRLQTIADKLVSLQLPDGSFTWYPGMQGSIPVTVTVAETLVRLQRTVPLKNTIARWRTLQKSLDNAIGYVGNEVVKLVNEMKQQERKGIKPSFPSVTVLRWLYICAVSNPSLPANVQRANDYLVALLKKDVKSQTIYAKALTAIVLNARPGDKRTAASYVKSLKEYSVATEEMGRYFDTPRAAYSWFDYRIPTEVAAIEAIQTVTPADTLTVDEMRRWLLQEKRSQTWGTPINSVNAIYAFLDGHAQQTFGNSAAPRADILADGQSLPLPEGTAGLGYVKTTVDNTDCRSLSVVKHTAGTSWGAVYASFTQPVSDVASSGSGMTVSRQLLTSDGQPLDPATLRVGQRVRMRITVECSRDMDFVQITDRRAACMEPVSQLSGYRGGAYVTPKDCATNYFVCMMPKGRHTFESEYFIDREGTYTSGTCRVQCAYAPEFSATGAAMVLTVVR